MKLQHPINLRNNSTFKKEPRIKWFKLSRREGDTFKNSIEQYLTQDLQNNLDVNLMWTRFQEYCVDNAARILGTSKTQNLENKNAYWWNSEVKQAIAEKKRKHKIWYKSKSNEDREKYNRAKSDAKRAIAIAKAEGNAAWYEEIEKSENETEIFKIAKKRSNSQKDIKMVKYVKDCNGKLLTNDKDIIERWYKFYNELLNEENPRTNFPSLPPLSGPIMKITEEEVEAAVKKMKYNKATGPDGIPSEVWKALGSVAITWLAALFNKIAINNSMPDSWRYSHIIPFYKQKGDVRCCENFRGIKLTSHTLKIWERVINS